MKSIESDLVRKAELQRAAHSFFEPRTRIISIILKTISIVIPALITFIAFSEVNFIIKFVPWLDSDKVKLLIGISAFFLFITGVIVEMFRVNERHSEHRRAIELYSQLIRDIKSSKETDLPDDQRKAKISTFTLRYQYICSNTIPFTDNEYNKAEIFFLRNRAKRQARKRMPFGWPWQIRALAIKLASEIHKNEREGANVVSIDARKSQVRTE